MAVMKQIDTCLTRFFTKMPPLRTKWFAAPKGNTIVALFHYHHLVLVYDFEKDITLYKWWEREADARGLRSALEWLHKNTETTKNYLNRR